jgi:rare lipoprotein A
MLKGGLHTLFAFPTLPAVCAAVAPGPSAADLRRGPPVPRKPGTGAPSGGHPPVPGRRDPQFASRAIPWICVILGALLSACAHNGGYYQDDGPPRDSSVDISSIPDAVPRREPLSDTGNDPYVAFGKRYVPMTDAAGYDKRGLASWYGRKWQGMRTSSGDAYNMYAMTAAHRTLPLPSYARVTNLANGKSVVVRINDRGPFVGNRLIDLSYAAAYKLGIIGNGTGDVEVTAIPTDSVRSAKAGSEGPNAAPVKDLSSDNARFYVQYGAFTQSADAKSLIQKLQQFGIRFARIQHGDDGYFRVRSGPFSQQATARHMVLYGAALGLSTTIVTE